MTLVQTEPKTIKIGIPKSDYSAMQGPCPDGFHVPLNTEWQAVYDIWTALGGGSLDGTNFGIALKLPFAGRRHRWNSNVYYQGSYGYYWSSTRSNEDSAYYLYFNSSSLNPQYKYDRSYAFSVRCFKDIPVAPTSSWTKLYGTSIEDGGIFWSSTDGLISLSSDGSNWITITDKNLGATSVWNSGDTLSQSNCGYYYQRGNNYGFPWTGSVTTSSTQVDASNYGPGNYYSSGTFITRSSTPYRWDSTDNGNLRGGETGAVLSADTDIKAVYIGTTKVRPSATPITTPGIYHNSDLGLISLSSDGSTRYTIADKNLGATSTNTASTNSYGKYYQWGNNYGFNYNQSITVVQNKVNVSTYGPNNYYSSSTVYVAPESSWRDFYGTTDNFDLWGGVTDTYIARRGPCDSGWHIPSNDDWKNLLKIYASLKGISSSFTETNDRYYKPYSASSWDTEYSEIKSFFMIPVTGAYNSYNGWNYDYPVMYCSDIFSKNSYNFASNVILTTGGGGLNSDFNSWYFYYLVPIRPFKNEAVQPDDSRTVLYQPS